METVETHVKRVVPGLMARDYGFVWRVQQGNEINTARRLLKIGFAPVDLLYSESLTKSYQKLPKVCVGPNNGHGSKQSMILS